MFHIESLTDQRTKKLIEKRFFILKIRPQSQIAAVKIKFLLTVGHFELQRRFADIEVFFFINDTKRCVSDSNLIGFIFLF